MAENNVRSSNGDVANLFKAIFLLIGRNILAIFVFMYLVWSTCCTLRVSYPMIARFVTGG